MRIGAAAHAIDAAAEEFVKHIIFVGGDHQRGNRQAHHPRHVAGADVAKVARGHGKTDSFGIVRRGLEVTSKVVHHLCHQACPVDGIDGSDLVLTFEIEIVRDGLDHVLAVIENALHRDVVDIVILQAEHLGLLERTHAAQRTGHENAHAFFAAHGVLGSAAGITAGGAQDVELLAATRQFEFKQVAQQLHGHVFESQRRTIGQCLQKQGRLSRRGQGIVQLRQGNDLRRAKNSLRVGLVANRSQLTGGNVVDVEREHFKGQCAVALLSVHVAPARELRLIDLRVVLGQVQAAIGCQTFQQDFTKVLAPGLIQGRSAC